jgi:hypothetical protein
MKPFALALVCLLCFSLPALAEENLIPKSNPSEAGLKLAPPFGNDFVLLEIGLQPEAIYDRDSIVPNPAPGAQLFPVIYFNYYGETVPQTRFELRHDDNELCSGTFSNLIPNEYVFHCNDLFTVPEGTFRFEGILDGLDNVVEFNETNNRSVTYYGTPRQITFSFSKEWSNLGASISSLGNMLSRLSSLIKFPSLGFNLCDLFILTSGSTYHYTGVQGGSTDDDFTWTIEEEGQDVGNGKIAARIRTDTDEPSDDRNGAVDFWLKEENGDIYFYGTHLPKDINASFATVPSQTVILTDPLRIGGNGQQVGDQVSDTGSGMVNVSILGSSPTPMSVDFQSTVKYQEVIPSFETPLGTFTGVVKVAVDIRIVAAGQNFSLTDSTFFFKSGVGMVGQAQKPDPNDAEVQEIDSGNVGGVPVVAN